mmetsp:Transcript_46118/g.98323  ORF Transcript_46118/g.98323 Transcript_46118/m.98323 type:complete len:92 (+) Transcript_46118:1574-1849(+)
MAAGWFEIRPRQDAKEVADFERLDGCSEICMWSAQEAMEQDWLVRRVVGVACPAPGSSLGCCCNPQLALVLDSSEALKRASRGSQLLCRAK